MSEHQLSTLLMVGFVLTFNGGLRLSMHRGWPSPGPLVLYGVLGLGLILTAQGFMKSIGVVDWSEGIVAFITLAGALANLHLIKHLCPDCHKRLNIQEAVANPPKRSHPGMGTHLRYCPDCGYYRVQTHTLARLAETSSEAQPWAPRSGETEGALGATYARGSAASSTWRTEPEDTHTEVAQA